MLNTDCPVDPRDPYRHCRTTLGVPQRHNHRHLESKRFPGCRRSVLSLSPQGILLTDQHIFPDQPESTGVESPASTGSSNTGSKTVNLPTNSPNHSSGGGSHAGAIAGGVVGGLAGVGILAALAVWFIMKKKRSKVAPSSAFLNSYQSSNKFNHPNHEPPPPPTGPSSPSSMVYSPSDPSMFSSAYPQTTYDTLAPRRGGYSGAPEV